MSRRCSFFLREFGSMGQMFLMHAYSLVSLVSTCNATVNAECVTNEVVQFFVCCGTFVLSVGLFFFFQRGVGFSQAFRMLKFETSSGICVGIRTGVLVSGCAGVRVCW